MNIKLFLLFSYILISLSISSNESFDVTKLYNSTIHQVFAGYLNVSNISQGRIFYQLFSPANQTLNNSAPLQVWFNGGPGCSSQIGNYEEFGPFFPYQNKSGAFGFTYNNFNYALTRNVLFVDQPIGVGMSYTGNDTTPNNTHAATDHMEYFFWHFFKVYPYLKTNPLYITGESYGGHYVPSFSKRLIEKGYKLAGVAVGDGAVNNQKQFELAPMLFATGVISQNRYKTYRGYENQALQFSLENNAVEASKVFLMESGEFVNSEDITNITGIDYLNYRRYDSDSINLSPFEAFLNSDNAKSTFQTPKNQNYISCSIPIEALFLDDIYRSFDQDFAFVVSNTRLLLYTGQNDVELNSAAGYKWISEMNWSGIENFGKSQKVQFKPFGEIFGFTKSYGNLSFAQINDAGHLVPHDQPQRASEMMNRWINGEF